MKIYDCSIQDNVIHVRGSLSGISRAPLFRFEQTFTVSRDGTVLVGLRGTVRSDAAYLPRLGLDWTLPGGHNAFAYYGNGPVESYRDMCHAGSVGLYESTAEKEYVPYVRPQEHGNHTGVRQLRIGRLEFTAEDTMEIQVSRYSTQALLKAEHTDELEPDGLVHLRTDYKVSGLGSNSCGPELEPQYRLSEKEISFRFAIRPLCEGARS